MFLYFRFVFVVILDLHVKKNYKRKKYLHASLDVLLAC